ncbi:MAG TPA: hypothetical protein VFB96_22140 [Pirellulaceae bacterium]|nr:hypothetical protein [Pirellulaceae bacterium]
MNASSKRGWWLVGLAALLASPLLWAAAGVVSGDGSARADDERRGDAPAAREGEREAEDGARDDEGLKDFKPQTEREEALYKRVVALERQLAALRREMAQTKGAPRRDGDAPRKVGPRDGERPKKAGPRDGEGPKKPGPRDGEGPKKPGPRDGEGPKKPGPRDGEKPAPPRAPEL